jgi:hypothetical protein
MIKKSKKYVYLWGGLGNVLYQINLAYYLYESGYKVFVNKGLLNYNNIFYRKIIKIHKGVYEQIDLFLDSEQVEVNSGLKIKDLVLLFIYKLRINIKGFKYFNHEWPNEIEISEVNTFFGYFQKTKYISQYLGQTFYSRFKPKMNMELIDLVRLDSTILIHARFGDKVSINEFDLNYNKVLHIFRKFDSVVVVTDDLKYAGRLFLNDNKKNNINLVSSDYLLDDFYLISNAKNVILSRSSFSWWATEISLNRQVIYQPEPFYLHLEWQHFSNKTRLQF